MDRLRMSIYDSKICPFCDGVAKYSKIFRKFVCEDCGASMNDNTNIEFWKGNQKKIDRAKAKKSRI